MNAKYILLFFICCNIISTIFSFGCSATGAACTAGGSGVITQFLIVTPTTNLLNLGGFSISEDLNTATTDMVTPFTGGTSSPTSGFTVFLDGLKMILGFITLLTPIPILDYAFSFGLPFYVNMIVFLPLFMLYVIGIMEGIGGRTLGK